MNKVIISEYVHNSGNIDSDIYTDSAVISPGKEGFHKYYRISIENGDVVITNVEKLPAYTMDLDTLLDLVYNKMSVKILPEILRGECLTIGHTNGFSNANVFSTIYLSGSSYYININYRYTANISFDGVILAVRTSDKLYIFKASSSPLVPDVYVPGIICFK
ncbi:hypothetical protein SBFV2_gp65 [Sulfolobales Beppu filamentous virus 2]|uniref:Uncharacterized protein n=1 Tax=Sulfolobales Beppu filamentous virus 2 TaxID=2493123 RepID=A0A3Q8Q3S8_9VIRU|nr:hypothetical protein HOU84_gp65 [Sulfolobales Beppu filamentous virus 2]AZI75832.1 hypothetical protein SBFV2_gp65 [Sulfolobales Beppu filamentous virus 2]